MAKSKFLDMVKMFNSDRLKTLKIDRLPDLLEEDGEIQEVEEVNLQPKRRIGEEKQQPILPEPLSEKYAICESVRNSLIKSINYDIDFIRENSLLSEQLKDILETYNFEYIGLINTTNVINRLEGLRKNIFNKKSFEIIAEKYNLPYRLKSDKNSESTINIIKLAAKDEYKH